MSKPIDGDGDCLALTPEGCSPKLALNALGGPLREAKWFSVQNGGYRTAEEARSAAKTLADIFLCVGVERTMGVDVGKDLPTTRIGDELREKLEKKAGRLVRDNIHGIDVFEDGDVSFFSLSFNLVVTDTPPLFLEAFRKIFANPPQLDDRQRVFLELINDALVAGSSDARLVLCVSAMEALCEPTERPEDVQNLISKLLNQLGALEGPYKQSLQNTLRQAAKQSRGEACRSKIRALLGTEREAEFRSIYRARNKLVHAGEGRGENDVVAGKAVSLVIDLARAEIRYPR